MNLLKFLAKRIVSITASLLVLSILIFIMMEIVPGDLARTIAGREATPEMLQVLRIKLGLDKPPHIRYVIWLAGALRGDFGESLSLHASIGPILVRRAGHSLILGLGAAIIGLPLAILQGFIAGLRRPVWIDPLLSKTAIIIGSLPEFLVAIIVIFIFSQVAGWFPSTAVVRSGSPLDNPLVLVLPITTLVLVMTAYNLRMTRASVIKTLDSEFIVAAELKQLPITTLMWKHVAPNALLPTITVAANYLGWLIGGLMVIEAVFAYPGLGLLIYSAAKTRDVPLLEASVLLVGGFRMFANLGADILYRILDPRVRI
jgi:peptide/nickel transport system permease protein